MLVLVILITFSNKYHYEDYKGDVDDDVDGDDNNIWDSRDDDYDDETYN